MTLPISQTVHTAGRFGIALLFAAGASGGPGFAQSRSARPPQTLASLSRPTSLVDTGSSAATPSHGLDPLTKPTPSSHPFASTLKPSPARPLFPVTRPVRAGSRSGANARPVGLIYPLISTAKPSAPRALASAPKLLGSNPPVTSSSRPAITGHPVAAVADPLPPSRLLASIAKTPGVTPALASLFDPSTTAFSMTGTASAEHTFHLTVGHLMFLNTRERVRRIYIANPAVLDSYTVSPNQIVITAKAPGLSSIVVWDQTDQSQIYMVSSDISVDELRASMKQAMPNDNVQVEGREAKVVLSGTVGTDASSDAAAKLAGLFSKDVANSLIVNSAKVRQVRLKVRIVEVDRSKLDQFGINIFNPGGGTTIGTGSTAQFPTSTTLTSGSGGGGSGTSGPVGSNNISISDPLNFLFYTSKLNLGLTVKDLENKQVLQILAEPTLTTLSGQKASFLAGGEFPFPVVQGSAGGTATVTVQFRPYGVKLEFTPVVNMDGSVALKVMPEVSALDFTNAVTISGYTIPALSTKRADTQVVLRSGQSFAISGLLDRRATDAFSKTPGISSVPILGQLFKSKGVTLSTSELIVIVTPTVVDPLSEPVGPEEPVRGEPAPIVPFMKPEAFDQSLPASARKP